MNYFVIIHTKLGNFVVKMSGEELDNDLWDKKNNCLSSNVKTNILQKFEPDLDSEFYEVLNSVEPGDILDVIEETEIVEYEKVV